MNKDINLKKIGLIIVIISSILIVMNTFALACNATSYYGNAPYWFSFVLLDLIPLSFVYYLCTKKYSPSDLFALRKATKGPLYGLIYVAYCFINGGPTFITITISVGYILILIHNITEIKQVRRMNNQKGLI